MTINVNYESMKITTLGKSDIRYLNDMLVDEKGQLNVLPFDVLKDVPQQHLTQFCVEYGCYGLPTQELVDFLKEQIGGHEDRTLEIGAGNGVLSRVLGIRGTDSLMQLVPAVRAEYEAVRQAIVPYGDHVEHLDGVSAVKKYRPDIVLASWVTHMYIPTEAWRGGNQFGVDEKKVLKGCKKYIVIGNESTHSKKPIMSKPHETIKAPWLLSRSMEPKRNAIFIWEGAAR